MLVADVRAAYIDQTLNQLSSSAFASIKWLGIDLPFQWSARRIRIKAHLQRADVERAGRESSSKMHLDMSLSSDDNEERRDADLMVERSEGAYRRGILFRHRGGRTGMAVPRSAEPDSPPSPPREALF